MEGNENEPASAATVGNDQNGGDKTVLPPTVEDHNANEVKVKMEHVLVSSSEKLKNVRRAREEKALRAQHLAEQNKKKDKRCKQLGQEINIGKEKSAQLKVLMSQFDEDEEKFVEILKQRKRDWQAKDQKSLEVGMEMLKVVKQQAARVMEKHKEYKSFECVQNGTNTMLFRVDELKEQIQPLESQLETLKVKMAELYKTTK